MSEVSAIGIGKRSGSDFNKHELIVTKSEDLLVHYLKKSWTTNDCIKYINTNGILAITGDYGNWIFCREFHPSSEGGISDEYWKEKLCLSSTQEPNNFDSERTKKEIEQLLNGGLEKKGYSDNYLVEMKRYFEECLNYVDDELEYTYFAYRTYPSFCDHEDMVFYKETKYWLCAVFDGFDEICRRLKEQEK